MGSRPMSGGEALVAQLEAIGVEVVFGIPGVHNLPIFDALRASAIRTIVVRHEQTAAYAADGYARSTGRLGVCVTTTGPGVANTAGAMGEARAARSPVLQIATQVESRILEGKSGRFSLHESPHQRDLMRAVARWSERVARADAIPSMVVTAAQAAFEGRRGPVFLEVPHDFLAATVKAQPAQNVRLAIPVPPESRATARAVATIARMKRPVVWAGGGTVSSGAHEEVTRLAEALDAPVVTTFSGKGVIPPDHPLAVGLPPHQPQVAALLSDSDGIVVVGSDLDGMNTQGWRLPLPRPRVSINTLAQDARRNYAAEVVVESDARLALEAILEDLPSRERGAGAKRVRAARAAALRSLRTRAEFAEPFELVETLAQTLPADAAVFADMAIAGYWTAAYYPAPAPRSISYPLGWGTLGFAFPAALGAAAAGRPTLAVCGDAGFLFAASELATAVEEGLPLVVLVVNDEGYGMLRYDQDERYGRRFAVDLHTPDFVGLARSFRSAARRVTPDTLATGLRWGLRRAGPALLEMRASFAPPLTVSPRWPLKGKPEARP